MDNISTADGIMWLFWGVILVMSLLQIFSATIWVNNKIIYGISYVGLMILVIFLIFSNIDRLKLLYLRRSKIEIVPRISIMIGIDIMCVVGSIINQKKRRIISNILINLATILSVVNFIMLQKVLWH